MIRIETESPDAFKGERVARPPLLMTPQGEAIISREAWEHRRRHIEADWRRYLGSAPFDRPPLDVRAGGEHLFDGYRGQILEIRMEPDYWEQCYLMVPETPRAKQSPAVIIFYYDIDTPAGHDMGSPRWREGLETRHFARHLVERGYVTLVQRWFYEGMSTETAAKGPLAKRYAAAVARQDRVAPGWKGLGRVIWDASRVVDYLETLDFVDSSRIACMGHSLGGKMALYATAFDRRFQAAIGSDLGIGLSFSNWDAPWYLGPEVNDPDFGRDHHQLLALIAPRPFLLIAGEDADGDRSWAYLNAARDVYKLYGAQDSLAMVNHRSGHTPTWDALKLAYSWLDDQLGHEPS